MRWPQISPTVMSRRSQSAPAAAASTSIICATTQALRLLRHTRPARRRRPRSRLLWSGTSFRRVCARTTSRSATCGTGSPFSSAIPGRPFLRCVNGFRFDPPPCSARFLHAIEELVRFEESKMPLVNAEKPEQIRFDVSPSVHVTALAYRAASRGRADVTLILAHGAGANQASSFMIRFATSLAARGIDTITFNFVYTEQRRRVPDRNDKLEHCYRTVIEAARSGKLHDHARRRKLVIGGKSMGGRIASQVAAAG